MKPFDRIRIVKWGSYETTTGRLAVRKLDGPKIVRATDATIVIDRDFASAHEASLRGFFEEAMGVCRIATGKDGLYAREIEWKADALRLLEEDAFEFLVPAFHLTKARTARRVISLALSNKAVPGFPSMRDLVHDYIIPAPGGP